MHERPIRVVGVAALQALPRHAQLVFVLEVELLQLVLRRLLLLLHVRAALREGRIRGVVGKIRVLPGRPLGNHTFRKVNNCNLE